MSSTAPATSKRRRLAARRSGTTDHATDTAPIPIGTFMSSTQRQLRYWVMTPLSSTPTAPPIPFIELHSEIARRRSEPSAKLAVMMPSDEAAISAPPNPWIARARMSTSLVGASPPSSEASANTPSAAENVVRWPYVSPKRPASIRKPPNMIA